MKTLLATRFVDIPEEVELSIKSRVVSVKGPRGEMTKTFKHQSLEMTKVGNRVRVDKWFGNKKELACIRSICSHISNMITGVTQGYRYKMRFVYAHFPINVTVVDNVIEIRNFLGEKRVRRVTLRGDTKAVRSKDVKDQLELEGNSIDDVSQTAAMVQQCTRVRNKDIRKFLDGIYVSEKGPIAKVDDE